MTENNSNVPISNGEGGDAVEPGELSEVERLMTLAHALGELATANSAYLAAGKRIEDAGSLARSVGATWLQIATSLDISPQAAQQRFDPEAKRRHAERQRRRSNQRST